MCGICGILTNNMSKTEVDVFRMLLFLNQIRGDDSTGVCSIKKPSTKDTRKDRPLVIRMRKEATEASTFLNYNLTKDKEALFETENYMMLGHCRSATLGSIKPANAHPFNFDNVIGVHNGTIRASFKGSKDYETDSEALYALINEIGFKDAMNEAESYTGVYSLVFIDKKEKTLNFYRNADRPMYFSYLYNGSTLIWASEAWMLSVVTGKKFTATECKPEALPVNTLRKFDLTATGGDLLKFTDEQWKPKVRSYTYSSQKDGGGHSNFFRGTPGTGRAGSDEDLDGPPWGRSGPSEGYWDRINKSRGMSPGTSQYNTQTQKWEPSTKTSRWWKGYKGVELTPAAFVSIMNDGCSYCGCQQDMDQPNVEFRIGWIDHDHYICVSCMEGEATKNDMIDHFVTYQATP